MALALVQYCPELSRPCDRLPVWPDGRVGGYPNNRTNGSLMAAIELACLGGEDIPHKPRYYCRQRSAAIQRSAAVSHASQSNARVAPHENDPI